MLRFAFLASAVGAYVAPTAHVRQAATRTPHAAMQFGGQGLPRRKADPEVPPVVVTGKTTGNLLFGKLQRAAQLPGARLGQTYAAVEDRGKLSSLLWSSFAMAAVTSGNWLDRDEMVGTYALEGALLFIDCTSADAGGGGFSLPSLPNPFAPKPAKAAAGGGGAAPEVDEELLKFAAARGAQHAYLLVDGDDAAVASAVAACEEAIGGFEGGSVTLCVTILAPVGGATLESTKGWAAETTAQDHEGVLSTPLSALVGYAPKLGVRKTEAASSGASAIPREDFAELATQVALRLGRTAAEGAPAVRAPNSLQLSSPTACLDMHSPLHPLTTRRAHAHAYV